MQIKKNIAISDSGFLFNPLSGDSYSVNGTGIEVIKLLRAGKNKEQIINELEKECRIDKNTLEKDLNDFGSLLETFKLSE